MKKLFNFLVLSIGLMIGSATHAALEEWTLSDVSFRDGGTASGTFQFDTATNVMSSINIDMSNASGAVERNLRFSCEGRCNSLYAVLESPATPDLTGNYVFGFSKSINPADPTSPVAVASGLIDGICENADCTTVLVSRGHARPVGVLTRTNQVTPPILPSASPVPTLSIPMLVLLSVFAGLAFFRIYRKA
ncbi:MAG: hypothetical protein RR899_09745 [Comamonas sp.]